MFCSGYDFAIVISLPRRLMNIHANAMTISICEMDIENVRFKKSVKVAAEQIFNKWISFFLFLQSIFYENSFNHDKVHFYFCTNRKLNTFLFVAWFLFLWYDLNLKCQPLEQTKKNEITNEHEWMILINWKIEANKQEKRLHNQRRKKASVSITFRNHALFFFVLIVPARERNKNFTFLRLMS